MLVTTTDTLPGYELTALGGPVMGTAPVRPGRMVTADNLEKSQHESCQHALSRLVASARECGANAVIGLRFSLTAPSPGAGALVIVTAVATTAMAVPVTQAAASHYDAMVHAGEAPPLRAGLDSA